MAIFGSDANYVGLDIGTTAIRAVQLRGGNVPKSIVTYGALQVDSNIMRSDSNDAQQQIGQLIQQLLTDINVTSREVHVGLPSSEVFTSVVDLPRVDAKDRENSIKFQVEQFLPTSLSESTVDWVVLGPSPVDQNKDEVLLVSAVNKNTEARLSLLESVGLEVVSIEADSVGLVRSLIPPTFTGAAMLLDFGAHSTDLIIVYNGAPRLVRSLPIGGENLVKSAMTNLNVDESQARQFINKFGVSKDKLEGQLYRAIEGNINSLLEEINKSIKFFSNRYGNVQIEKVVVNGGASQLPEFPNFLLGELNIGIEIGNPWQNISYPNTIQANLMSSAASFGVATGLALRSGD